VLECSLRPANVDGQVLPFDVAAPAHTITERAQRGRRRRHGCEKPNAPHPLALLRPRSERPLANAALRMECLLLFVQPNEFLPKPYMKNQLFTAIAKLIGSVEG
jgi:hypothetical protein